MKKIYYTSFVTKIGTIYIASTEKGVCKISIPGQSKKDFLKWIEQHCNGSTLIESSAKNKQVIDEIHRYFERRLVRFRTRIDPIGTDFQKKVWQALRKVQYGKTISYKDLAKKIGAPKSYRAVGRANHLNPLPIIIPCHRVIRSDENIGGYSAGVKLKEFLLRLEGAIPTDHQKVR